MRYLIVFAFIGVFLTACKEEADQTPQLQAKAQVQETCSEKILVIIDGLKFSVSRGVKGTLANGKTIPYVKNTCEFDVIENPRRIVMGGPDKTNFLQVSSRLAGSTAIDSLNAYQKELKVDNTSEVLINGMTKVTTKNTHYYVFPSAKFETYDGNSVVVKCSHQNGEIDKFKTCTLSYTHPLGIKIWNDFFYQDYSVDEFFEVDWKIRNYIDEIYIGKE